MWHAIDQWLAEMRLTWDLTVNYDGSDVIVIESISPNFKKDKNCITKVDR